VTSIEVERLLAELRPGPGQPEGDRSRSAADSASTPPSGTAAGAGSSSQGSSSPFLHRRLYQIREGSMISGVCTGLAEYMRIDVTFIRIMFVLFALMTGGWGILAYVVLMFVVPRVETRAAASAHDASGTTPHHRWPWDDGWPWDKHGWPWDHPRTPPPPPPPPGPVPPAPGAMRMDAQNPREAASDARQAAREARQDARDARREWRDQRRAARMAYHPANHFWGSFLLILCVVFAFFWLSVWTRGHVFFGWPYFWGFPHWVGLIVLFMVIRLIFMPFRGPHWYGYGYGPYAHPHYAWVSMWNGLAWFAVMIFGIWAAYHYIPEFRDFIRSFQASWQDPFRV
jgi:phage shock protein PspC (stress-responsive transcriptional regulator)